MHRLQLPNLSPRVRRSGRHAPPLAAAALLLCPWFLAPLVLALSAAPALAGISSTTGAVSVISHPTGTLNANVLESDTTLYVWFEQKLRNPGSQSLDHVGSGNIDRNSRASPGTVAPNVAETYVVHFDQDNNSGTNSASVSSVTITFTDDIIGVWFLNSSLYGSDTTWAPSGLTYGTTLTSRPLELGPSGNSDRFIISSDLRTLTIVNVYTVGNGVDQMRILVSPEPGTWALLGLGLAGLGSVVLRRRRRREGRPPAHDRS